MRGTNSTFLMRTREHNSGEQQKHVQNVLRQQVTGWGHVFGYNLYSLFLIIGMGYTPKKPTDIKMIECYLGMSIPTSVWCHNSTRCAFECHWCPGQWFNPKDFSSPTHLVDLVQMLSNDPIRVARFRV
ncbi:hypothetical protein BT69DRAFT_987739 [Atractiella rhizophila]|nr:hypothetical protein BT69DRAFT_987739 [Atractiella rhizophila]